jgi:hypothetical protein
MQHVNFEAMMKDVTEHGGSAMSRFSLVFSSRRCFN